MNEKLDKIREFVDAMAKDEKHIHDNMYKGGAFKESYRIKLLRYALDFHRPNFMQIRMSYDVAYSSKDTWFDRYLLDIMEARFGLEPIVI